MKKKQISKKSAAIQTKPDGLAPLIAEVRNLIQSARHAAASTVNTLQVMTNFEIGRRIVEHEQKGARRAGYGQEMLKALSAQLSEEFGKGFSRPNLEYMRKFYLLWREHVPQIPQQPAGKSAYIEICQKPSDKLAVPERRAENFNRSALS